MRVKRALTEIWTCDICGRVNKYNPYISSAPSGWCEFKDSNSAKKCMCNECIYQLKFTLAKQPISINGQIHFVDESCEGLIDFNKS